MVGSVENSQSPLSSGSDIRRPDTSSSADISDSAELFYRRRTGSLAYQRFESVAAAVRFATQTLTPKELGSSTIESDRQNLRNERGRYVVVPGRGLAA